MALTVTEKWICERVNLRHDNLDDVKSLSLPGSYHEKVAHLGNSLKGFTRLKHLDLSRNDISILDGLDHLKLLETLNLYYNSISSLKELYKLRHNSNLKEIDIRLNPVTKNEPDYRLFLVHMIPTLKMIDDRSVRDNERKAALAHFDTDQASQFDESPPKLKPKQDLNQVQRHSRRDLVHSLAAKPSVLDDDDVALIDLMSHADVGKKVNQQSKYQVETYDAQELKRLPSPHAEKYSQIRSSGIEQPTQNYRRKPLKEHVSHESYPNQDVFYNQQSFISNGHFTANPQNGTSDGKVGYRVSPATEDDSVPVRSMHRISDGSKQEKAQESHSSSYEEIRDYIRERSTDSTQRRQLLNTSQGARRDGNQSSKEPFVSFKDFRNEENTEDAMPSRSSKGISIQQEPQKARKENLLWSILVLVDKYWNGSGSLQTNAKFQAIAGDLISNYLTQASDVINDDSDEATKREKEIKDLRDLLSEKEADNERIRKRLHNEDEIQQTIEMADKDLRRLQTRIEDIQAENKALKTKCLESDAERKSVERLRVEADEMKRIRESVERENRTLSQQCEQQATTLVQLQELTSMLQESHRSLVVTNDHLLQELDETRQRHQQEVQQLHWSYEQLKKTADWLPRPGK